MQLSRGGHVLSVMSVVSVGLLAPGAVHNWQAATGPDFQDALVAAASLLQLTLASWVLMVVILAHARTTIPSFLAPELMRRALFAGAVGALAVMPAHADRGGVTAPASTRHTLDGLRLPDRPTIGASQPDAVVIVEPGDTLWAIAARSLPAGSTDSEIAAACARWHDTNRTVIGSNPDLIHPRQRLIPPASRTPSPMTSPTENSFTKDTP